MARAFVLAHHLGNDILCALYSVGSRLHFALDKSFGSIVGTLFTSEHNESCKRFESLLTSNLSFCSALWLEWQIDVLESLHIVALSDTFFQFGSHLPLFGDGFADSVLALFHLAPFVSHLTDGCYLHFVERTGALLSVAGDKWDCAPLVEEFDGVLYASL